VAVDRDNSYHLHRGFKEFWLWLIVPIRMEMNLLDKENVSPSLILILIVIVSPEKHSPRDARHSLFALLVVVEPLSQQQH